MNESLPAGAPPSPTGVVSSRDKMLDAAGRLLSTKGADFSLPELARTAGVSTATAYRHFTNTQEVFFEFYHRKVGTLVAALQEIAGQNGSAMEQFTKIGRRWTEVVTRWGTSAAHIRSPEGFLERVRRGEPHATALHATLAPVIQSLVAEGEIPPQSVDYAVLLWINVFDERAVADLTSTLGWTSRRVSRVLMSSVLGALSAGDREEAESPTGWWK